MLARFGLHVVEIGRALCNAGWKEIPNLFQPSLVLTCCARAGTANLAFSGNLFAASFGTNDLAFVT